MNFGIRGCLYKSCLGVILIMDNEILIIGNIYLEVEGMIVFLVFKVGFLCKMDIIIFRFIE